LMDYLPVEPGRPETLVIAEYPKADASLIDDEAEGDIGAVTEVVRAIRNLRAEFRIQNNVKLEAIMHAPEIESVLDAESATVRALARVDPLTFATNGDSSAGKDQVTLVLTSGTVVVPLGGLVDLDVEMARLAQELSEAETNIARLEKRLTDEQFVSKAPEEVVDRERQRLVTVQERRDRIQEILARLGGAV